ncbi:MAG: FtsQ-type POTRA domain-containing protein [Verrucomicrobiaceae bacterium]
MIPLFPKNKPRKKRQAAKGNYAFRRKSTPRSAIHRLELNPETEASRRARFRKRAGLGARLAVGILSSIMLVAILKVVVMEAFVANPRFRLQDISVHTEGPLSRSSIVTASGLKEGDNLLMISLRDVRDKVESLPEVCGVKVQRNFPGQIVIDVKQRTPVAWLECPDKAIAAKVSDFGCLLDETGCVLPSSGRIRNGENKLPVIRVGKLTAIIPGKQVESASALASLELLRAHQRSPLASRAELKRVDATRSHSLVADFDGGVSVVFPANGDNEKEFSRLARAMDEATRHNWKLATVNLLVEHNVPVTLRGNATTASSETIQRTLVGTR